MKYLSGLTVLLLSFGAVLLFTQTVEAGEAAKVAKAAKDALNMNINIGNLSEPKQVAGIVKILLVMTSCLCSTKFKISSLRFKSFGLPFTSVILLMLKDD